MENKRIYIVLSQTGTILSRLLKFITKDEYNHVSLSLSEDLNCMYSFGRKWAYYPFYGGFVKESPYYGTFKRFFKSKLLILAVSVSDSQYEKILTLTQQMSDNNKIYRYNYLGLLVAAFGIYKKYENKFYCSEFVKYMLDRLDVEGAEALGDIVRPMDFLKIPSTAVYKGRLNDYINS